MTRIDRALTHLGWLVVVLGLLYFAFRSLS